MRTHFLLALALWAAMLSACVAQPITPVHVEQYPSTWTPAPTPTNTPPGPTATLVIQRTPGPLPTRDPNARRVPNAPRDGIGVWLDAGELTPEGLQLLAPRAQIFAALKPSGIPRNPGTFALFKTAAQDAAAPMLTDPLDPKFDGVFVAGAAADTDWSKLQASIKPRLVVVEVSAPTGGGTSIPADADGICFCNFLREADAPRDSFKSESDWKRDVDTLAALSSNPNAIVLTATRFPDDAAKNFDSMQAWLNYALASFLLGASNSHTFFGFQGNAAQEFLGAPEVAVRLGSPQGGMFKGNGVYQRRFARGLVLVNPGNEERAFALSRNYVNVSGLHVTQVVMPPHSGMILLNAE